MRNIWALLIGAAALAWAVPASAQNYPWCADLGVRGGATNCGFASLGQCRAYLSGIGGSCRPNLFYRGPEPAPRPARKKKPRR